MDVDQSMRMLGWMTIPSYPAGPVLSIVSFIFKSILAPHCCSQVGREAGSGKVVRLLVDAFVEHNKTVLSAEDARGAISRLTLSSAYDDCVGNMVEE